jgi:light-regulated signal transduction histidine kinase (bacteriophytochrome)
MFGRAAAQLVGHSIDELVVLAADLAGFASLLAATEVSEPRNQRAVGRRGDRCFPLEFSLSRVQLDQRLLYTLIVRDTSLHEAAKAQMHEQMLKLQEVKENLEAKAAELARTNRELDDFTYVASHDLKEPLRGISAYCHILLEDYGEKLDADGQRRLGALVDLCCRLSRLIDDLLTYSRIGRTQPEQAALDLNDAVNEVIDTLEASIDQRRAAVTIEGRLPTLVADRVLVGEVYRNLITNALKFNDSSRPRIEIGCAADGVLYVRDNGIGIEERHHDAIFAMFRRLHSRRKYDGTGAGLALVRKIVEAHGGRVWLESQPGAGSTFYFTLGAGYERAEQELAGSAADRG